MRSFGFCFGIVWCWRSTSCFRLLASLPYMSIHPATGAHAITQSHKSLWLFYNIQSASVKGFSRIYTGFFGCFSGLLFGLLPGLSSGLVAGLVWVWYKFGIRFCDAIPIFKARPTPAVCRYFLPLAPLFSSHCSLFLPCFQSIVSFFLPHSPKHFSITLPHSFLIFDFPAYNISNYHVLHAKW